MALLAAGHTSAGSCGIHRAPERRLPKDQLTSCKRDSKIDIIRRTDQMAIQYDIHMHSSFSTDSDAPMETMVRGAMEKGLAGVCFTEHLDLDFPWQSYSESPGAFEADPKAVYSEITRLRGKLQEDTDKSSFRIGFGMEFGMQPHLSDRYHEVAKQYPLDFITASQHLVRSFDPYYPDTWKNTAPADLIDCYYREMLSNLRRMQDWDSLSHMDYIIRYIPDAPGTVYDSMRFHSEVIDEILRHVISQGKCLEVNTAGYRYGLGQPNPSESILRRYRALGGSRITIGADAHEPEHISSAFDQAQALLRSLGFRTYCIFIGRRMQELQL